MGVTSMQLRLAFLTACLIACSSANASRRCHDAALPPEQRWNGGVSYSSPALDRFYDLSGQVSAAYRDGDYALAESLALEYLETAKQFPCNWNYGNAVHNANVILGLTALRRGRKAEAVVHLYAAGETPGSPQLDTFGPSLLLARELAQVGEYKAASDYLSSIRRFWKATDRSILAFEFPLFADPDPLRTWIRELDNGRVPDFGAPFNMDAP